MELTLCCDIIVASSTAQFGLAEAKRGLVAMGGGCFRLPKRLPNNIAMEMVITAQPKSASDMERFGYVNRVVAPGTTLDAALELAELIVRNAPLAVRASKAIMSSSLREGWSDTDSWEKQMEIYAPVHVSDDLKEGLRAFAEKRDPVWLGK
jgi:enoyl-CoA hydratase